MADTYFPPAESQGGWRYLQTGEELRTLAGMDADKLDLLRQLHEYLYGGHGWSLVIIRHGYLVREFYTFNVSLPTRFDIWSCTKSLTGTAWGLLLEDSRQHALPGGQQIDLDSPVYAFLPAGQPLSDPRKERILLRHLLSMTSGIPGESQGLIGMPMGINQGPFEHALGRSPNRFGRSAARLLAEPGAVWDYSDPAFVHLSLLFAQLASQEMSDYLHKRIFAPIGVENLSWDTQGGSGFLGPHTNAHTGIHISARELARVGYLMLRGGVWAGQQLIPKWWIDIALQPSQTLNPTYGYSWWVNTQQTHWPGLPKDAFALAGYNSNRCYIIPSLDLVVARVGSGPSNWEEQGLITSIVNAITVA